MDKKYLIAGLAVVVLIITAILLTIPQSETPPAAPTETVVTTPSPTPAATPTPTQTPQLCTTLVVLTRHPSDILETTRVLFLKSEVAKRYGIRDVVFRPVAAAQWRAIIQAGEADVAWGGGPTLFDALYKEGLLLPLEGPAVAEALRQIPKTLAGMPMVRTGPDGKVYWAAWAVSSFGFTINKKVLDRLGLPEPRTWGDLASLEYGRALLRAFPATGLAQLTRSTSHTRMAEIIIQAYGWEEGWRIIKLTAANGRVFAGSEPVRDAVIGGEIGVGWTIDFFGYTAQLQNPDTKYIIPPDTSVNGDPIAVVANTKCREAAEAFVAWVLTEGQVIVFDPKINRMPVNPAAFNTPEGMRRGDLKEIYDKLTYLKTVEFNDTLALAMELVVMYYFDAAVTDNIDILQRVWTKIVRAYAEGRISRDAAEALARELTEPVSYTDPETGQVVKLTLEQAVKINDKLRDSGYRDRVYAAWREAARRKYLEVERKV
ncbi:MAG: ABC transporter substrate-binding protein [Pyrobaculum sp.]